MADPAAPGATRPQVELAFLILQGGGAKGLGHVGALKAVEDAAIAPGGVAGASAGAIVAMLAAVGYTPDRIYDPASGANILSARPTPLLPVDFLGRRRWWLLGRLLSPWPWLVYALGLAALLVFGAGVPGPWWAHALALVVAFAPFYLAPWLLAGRGYFHGEGMRNILNEVLRDRLREMFPDSEPPELVCFRDIAPARTIGRVSGAFVPLKIVATDVTADGLVVFDSVLTPDVVVADAVTASASIPLVFRPARVRCVAPGKPVGEYRQGSLYCDGGLVANLPVWLFEADRRGIARRNALGTPPPVIAFTLNDAQNGPGGIGRGVRGWLRFFSTVIRTAIFGSQATSRLLAPDVSVIDLPVSLGVLAFDLSRAEATRAHRQGYDQAAATLEVRRLRRRLTKTLLEDFIADAQKLIVGLRGSAAPTLRASLIYPVRNDRTQPIGEFRVWAGVNMRESADDRLPLDVDNPIAPRAFRDNKAVLRDLDLSAMIGPGAANELFMTKYERALLPPALRSVIAVPIVLVPGAPVGVLCIDSTASLADVFGNAVLMNWLAAQATVFDPRLVQGAV